MEIYERALVERLRLACEQRVRPCRMINLERMRWRQMRAEVLMRLYGRSSNLLTQFFHITELGPQREIVYENKVARIIDKGPLITARDGNLQEIEAMLELARLKGWSSLHFTGTEEFKRKAMRRALAAGFEVSAHNQEDQALLQRVCQDLTLADDSSPRLNAPAPRPQWAVTLP